MGLITRSNRSVVPSSIAAWHSLNEPIAKVCVISKPVSGRKPTNFPTWVFKAAYAEIPWPMPTNTRLANRFRFHSETHTINTSNCIVMTNGVRNRMRLYTPWILRRSICVCRYSSGLHFAAPKRQSSYTPCSTGRGTFPHSSTFPTANSRT